MDERVGVVDRADDVEPVVTQQTGQPVSEERKVFGDQDAHGSSARSVVPPPDGLTIESVPSSASTRRRRPVRPEPDASAPPRPSSAISTTSVDACRARRTSICVAPACFAGVRERLRDDEVRGRLDHRGRPLRDVGRDVDRDRARVGERRDRSLEPTVGQHRRMHSAREVAQLPERSLHPGPRLDDELARGLGIAGEALLRKAEVHAERNEPRLRTVVEVALDAAQIALLDVDRPGARRLEHLDALLEPEAARNKSEDSDRDREPERRPHGPEVPAASERPERDLERLEEHSDARDARHRARRTTQPPVQRDRQRGRREHPARPERAADRRPDDQDDDVCDAPQQRRAGRRSSWRGRAAARGTGARRRPHPRAVQCTSARATTRPARPNGIPSSAFGSVSTSKESTWKSTHR